MKIAIIGAGSSYTPEIIQGLLHSKTFAPLEVAFYDLPEGRGRVETICALAGRMAKKTGAVATFRIADTLPEALTDCRFVVSQFRVGLMKARIHDRFRERLTADSRFPKIYLIWRDQREKDLSTCGYPDVPDDAAVRHRHRGKRARTVL